MLRALRWDELGIVRAYLHTICARDHFVGETSSSRYKTSVHRMSLYLPQRISARRIIVRGAYSKHSLLRYKPYKLSSVQNCTRFKIFVLFCAGAVCFMYYCQLYEGSYVTNRVSMVLAFRLRNPVFIPKRNNGWYRTAILCGTNLYVDA